MKHLMKKAYRDTLPKSVVERRDKMGFPVPLKEWFEGPLQSYVREVFSQQKSQHAPIF